VAGSIAEQSVEELGGRWSVLTRQKADHERLNGLLRELDRTEGDAQDAVLLRIDRLVFPHAFAEESVLWPVLRRALPDGEALTLEVEREHQEVNALVSRLEGLSHGDPERRGVLARLVEVLREDVRDEEDVLFPRLQAVVSPRELRRLGILWEGVRRVAPTRAHPVVARRPPGNAIAAVPLTLIDRLRDRLQLTALARPSAEQPLAAAGRALTRLARAVERLPLMRAGEDASTRIPEKRPGGCWCRRSAPSPA
jgi:hemerythrin superfamily protein